MNTLGLVNVLNNDGNVLIDVAQMADNHIQNAAIHNALAEWNETDDPFSPETTQRLIGKLKGEMPSLIAWLSEGNYPKSSLVPELLAYVKMPHPLQVYKNLDLDITIEDSEKEPAWYNNITEVKILCLQSLRLKKLLNSMSSMQKEMLWIASGKRQSLKVSISHTRKQK